MRRLFITLLTLAILALPALAQDAPPSDTSGVTVTEVAQLDRRTGPGNTSAHLSPDGQRILHIDRDMFCVLTIDGTEEGCYALAEQTGLHAALLTPDHDTVTWSPDSRFVAYVVEGWVRGSDMDILMFAANTGQLTNLTDDGYDGSILRIEDDASDTAFIDYAPAWKPDGTLTFARNSVSDPRRPAELWSLGLGDAEPVKVADLHPDEDELGTVMSMEWSADGATLAYTLYHSGDQSGLWLYDAATGQTEFLLPDVREERGNAMRATFSPDASQILLLTSEREQFVTDQVRDGHYIVSTETGEITPLDPEVRVMSAGWLPDGSGLIYAGRPADFPAADEGVYISGNPAQAGRLALTGTIGEDEAPYRVFAPTNRVRSALKVSPDGTMLLGTSVAQALIVTRVEGYGPVPLQAQTAPEAQATLPMVTELPPVTVAPSITETPAPESGDQGAFTAVSEIARLSIPSGIQTASSHLLPDGETLINAQGNVFCEMTLEGEDLWCVEAIYTLEGRDRSVSVDAESITLSPDGRYLAFTTDALRLMRDPDIWVIDLETQQVTNLTDDGSEESIFPANDTAGAAPIDLAPAWRPDGMLTFARHPDLSGETIPSLWVIDPAGGEPEKLADFVGVPGNQNLVLSMDWSSDGSRMAFVLDSQSNTMGGLWLYEVENNTTRPLVVPQPRAGYLTAEFSPDGQSILLQSMHHAGIRTTRTGGTAADNGYFVVSLNGTTQNAQAPHFIMNAGWLPDGSLLYVLSDREAPGGGVFLARSAGDMAEPVMENPVLEDGEVALLLGPTPRQWAMIPVTADGRFALGSTQGVTLVLKAESAQVVEAAPVSSATETPIPEVAVEPGPIVVRGVARLDLPTGPMATSSRLLPDGETLIHAQMNNICAYTLAGEEQWCVEVIQHVGSRSGSVRVDQETITLSPDGRYLAFTSDALLTFSDPDIWVLDLETQEYTNLTEDGYVGSMMLSDDIPDDLPIDLAPAWRPDGMLTFARHTSDMRETTPSLWMIDPAGGEPEKLADFEGVPGSLNLVTSMNWSPDGSRMAFVMDSLSNPFGGLWVYEADKDNMKPLIIPPEDDPGLLRADFSPDGRSILLMSELHRLQRAQSPNEVPQQTGYYVVAADTGRATPVQADSMIMGIGWMPDGRLLYVGRDPILQDGGSIFVVPAQGGEATKVMDSLLHEGQSLIVFAPTPIQLAMLEITPNGRFVLGSVASVTPVLQVTPE